MQRISRREALRSIGSTVAVVSTPPGMDLALGCRDAEAEAFTLARRYQDAERARKRHFQSWKVEGPRLVEAWEAADAEGRDEEAEAIDSKIRAAESWGDELTDRLTEATVEMAMCILRANRRIGDGEGLEDLWDLAPFEPCGLLLGTTMYVVLAQDEGEPLDRVSNLRLIHFDIASTPTVEGPSTRKRASQRARQQVSA
ncbi:hypothetical protein [Singulisphaera sp. PoT]|uniref:hypothetical protein n=1 Tax=Singulisphaera sp. PoT TaxID=3411797 RepID=UPI003BF5A98C